MVILWLLQLPVLHKMSLFLESVLGDTAPDGFGVGTESAKVRAERAGGGNSRVYQITFVAVDDKGAECAGAVITAVTHDQGANTLIVNDGQIYVSTGP